MKSHKSGWLGFALVATLLGASACDDQTEVVIPPPEPDPITVTVTPAGPIEMIVDQSITLAATVGGGDSSTDRTVAWSTSSGTVATVGASTGVVTAVAPGIVTITATATADANAKAAVQVTVIPDPVNAPVTVTLSRITTLNTNTPVDVNNVFGQIDATVTMDIPQGAVVNTVQLLLDGTVVAEESFAGPSLGDAAAAEELDAIFEVVLSVSTSAFNAATGVVSWKNGPHNLQARVIRPNGTSTATPSVALFFNNTSFISATYSGSKTPNQLGTNSPRSLLTAGRLWHSGDIIFDLLTVNYGPATDDVATVTINLTTSGNGVTGVGGCTSGTDALTNPTIAVDNGGAGPAFTLDTSVPGCAPAGATRTATVAANVAAITFPSGSSMSSNGVANVEDFIPVGNNPIGTPLGGSIIVNSVTTGGQVGPICVNPNATFNPQGPACLTFFQNPLAIDNLAPRVTQLSIERPPNQYFGPNIFNLSHAVGGVAGCTAPCARTVDYGVGSQSSTGNTIFLAGPPTAPVTVTSGGSELAESGTSNDYIFGVRTQDSHANQRTVWATSTTSTISTSATSGSNRRFGWDATMPIHTVTAGPANNAVNPDETDAAINPIVVSFSDIATPPAGPSGFLANPVRVKTEHFAFSLATNPTCRNPDSLGSVSCSSNGGFVQDDGMFFTPGDAAQGAPRPLDGYFNYSIFVQDAAANNSVTTMFLILEDVTAPAFTGGIVAPATINGGQAVGFSSALTDNVDLGSLIPYVGFGGATYIGYPLQSLGTFGPTPLNGIDGGLVSIAAFPRSVEANAAGLPSGAVTMASEISYNVRDMAGQQLRYVVTPWPVAPDDGVCPLFNAPNTATQNCSNREVSIAFNVLAGVGGIPVTSQFTALNTANGLNPLHGLFTMQPPSNPIICNNTLLTNCTAALPTSTVLTADLTGPVGTFQTPFTEVRFYFVNGEGRADLIATATVLLEDNTISSTRTFHYTATWDATNLKVRPAGPPAGGTAYAILAIGFNATGDGLASTVGVVTVEGN